MTMRKGGHGELVRYTVPVERARSMGLKPGDRLRMKIVRVERKEEVRGKGNSMIEIFTDGGCEPVNPKGIATYGFTRIINELRQRLEEEKS